MNRFIGDSIAEVIRHGFKVNLGLHVEEYKGWEKRIQQEFESIKDNQLEITITEIKNLVNGFNILDTAEERISELEN